jgi:hypothetical protein
MILGLGCNASGNDNVKMVVVHKSNRPHCFGSTFNPNTLVDWFSDKTAWMQTGVLEATMKRYNSYFHGRKVLTLMDNVATHRLRNIQLTEVHGMNVYAM